MAVLPFMGDAPTQSEDERIVQDLLSQLKATSPAPQQRPRPGVAQSILGVASDALMNKARVTAGGLPQTGDFAREMQRVREEDEADRRDYIKSQRDVESRIRIGVAEGKLREMSNMRAENRENLRVISQEQREEKRRREQRQQDIDDALNRDLITRGAIDEIEGDFRKLPFEERAKLLGKSMGARTPSEAYEQFVKAGLSDKFRVKSIEAFADGTYAPTLEPIDDTKEDKARNQEMIEKLAAAGVPREQLIERALALGVDEELAGVLGDLSDNVTRNNTIKAKVQALDDITAMIVEEKPDLASDIAELRGLVEGKATYDDAVGLYSDIVEGARRAIEAHEKNPQDPDGWTRDKAARHAQEMRRLIRQYLGYEMPDVSFLRPATSAPEGATTSPADEEGDGFVSSAVKGAGRLAKDVVTGAIRKPLLGGDKSTSTKSKVKSIGGARINK